MKTLNVKTPCSSFIQTWLTPNTYGPRNYLNHEEGIKLIYLFGLLGAGRFGLVCYKPLGDFGCSTTLPAALVSPSDRCSLWGKARNLSSPLEMLQEMIAQYKEALVGKTEVIQHLIV